MRLENWDCNNCSKKFSSFSRFKKHNPKKCLKNKKNCFVCGKKFNTYKSKIMHEKRMHK